ncbi:hypothetical protein BD779DRAFT_1533512 [Infundibulicybe gibba]|nr:hypothetical protein BD779DRAFT_1533512 [Infundibulicybe gibba]
MPKVPEPRKVQIIYALRNLLVAAWMVPAHVGVLGFDERFPSETYTCAFKFFY